MKPFPLFLALAFLPLAGQAAPPAPRAAQLAQRLELSPEQQTRLRGLRATQREAMKPLRLAQRQARQALRASLKDPDAPEAVIRERYRQASEAHLKVLLARRSNRAELRSVLTPAQQLRAKEGIGIRRGPRRNSGS